MRMVRRREQWIKLWRRANGYSRAEVQHEIRVFEAEIRELQQRFARATA